jgi:predicted nuclease of predicted toxin-antitoxin system
LDLPDANRTEDKYINELSIKENRVVITKDSDFLESFLIKLIPAKLVIVKTGNITNRDLFMILEKHIGYICEALSQSSLIEINKTEIIVH